MTAVVYGMHAVDAVLRRQPRAVRVLRVQDGRADRRLGALLALAANQGVPVQRVARADLDQAVNGRHQGVVAELLGEGPAEASASAALESEAALWQHLETLDHPPLLLVLDGITDPHNLGACLRSADAAGVDAVIIPKDKSASITPVVRKVACGAAEAVPLLVATNLARVLAGLRERGIWLYGAAGEADHSLYTQDLRGAVALVLGAEGSGLRRLTREYCDVLVHLPMAGSVSSLNVSVAAGVCLFEVVRQRACAAGSAPV